MKKSFNFIFAVLILALANAASASAQTCTPAPVNLVLWYAGDGDALDSRSRNNGTLQNGAAFAVGKVGQSFSLDGNDDSIRLPLNQSFQNFTLESWVKPNSAVNDPINQELILGQAGFGAQMSVIPGTNGGMRVKIQYRDTINSFAQVISTTDIPLNDWSHLVGTFDGTTLKLYVNGVLNAQLNPTNTTVQTCNTPYFIGGFQPVTDCNAITNPPFQFFNGLIDEASVYNRALTDAEITSIVNAGIAGKLKQNAAINTNSSVSLWQGENNANDTRGANNGSLQNGTTFAAGRVGQAFSFDGVDDSVSLPNNSSLNPTSTTVEGWINANQTQANVGGWIYANRQLDVSEGFSVGVESDKKIVIILKTSSGVATAVSPVNSFQAVVFQHIAITYDEITGTLSAFVNGTPLTLEAV